MANGGSSPVREEGKKKKSPEQFKTLLSGGLAHIAHDGISDMLYVFFPLWQSQLALSLAQVGFLKTVFSGTMALFQLPSGFLSERFGEARPLIAGTLLTGTAIFIIGWSNSFPALCFLLALGGLGSSVQHPLASSLISGAHSDHRERRIALGTYNMCGDIGKFLLPASAALLIASFGWRTATHFFGAFVITVAIFLFWAASKNASFPGQDEPTDRAEKKLLTGWQKNKAFWALSAVGIIDSGTRTGFLTFFPFLLQAKGAAVGTIGLTLSLVFAGGAAGKFLCGVLSTRLGALQTVIVSESVMALLISSTLVLPLKGILFLAPLIGTALNGTSSVLYGSVPEIASGDQEKQAFAAFYTVAIGANAAAPFLYGLLAGQTGVPGTILTIALVSLIAIPLTLPLKKHLAV